MPQVYENREISLDEIRAESNPQEPGFSGYAARFLIPDSHGSVFGRNAFRKTVRERGDRIPILFNHDPDKIIGKAAELRSDATGLRFRARVNENVHWGKEVMELVRSELLSGMSFRFWSVKERSGLESDKIDLSNFRNVRPEELRFVEEAGLREISPVTFPSNDAARIESYRSDDRLEFFEELTESIRAADLDPDHIARLTALIDSFRDADTLDEPEPPLGTSLNDDESRHKLDMDFDLFTIEVNRL